VSITFNKKTIFRRIIEQTKRKKLQSHRLLITCAFEKPGSENAFAALPCNDKLPINKFYPFPVFPVWRCSMIIHLHCQPSSAVANYSCAISLASLSALSTEQQTFVFFVCLLHTENLIQCQELDCISGVAGHRIEIDSSCDQFTSTGFCFCCESVL
jgi:hypothetical protein